MAAQGLLSSVFSCSSDPRSSSNKRRLRHTRSSDPVLMRHDGTEAADILSEGDFTWSSVSGRSVDVKPVPLQSLSELERSRLQEVAFRRLLRDRDLGRHITIPKNGHKRKKSLRRKFDSLSKERARDKEMPPQVFGLPLSEVISADRRHKRRRSPQRDGHSDPTELMLSFLHLTSGYRRANRELSSSNSSLSSASETPCESPPLRLPDVAPRTHRRGGVSVDCITDLDDNQSQLLEALQLSLPVEAAGSRNRKRRDKKLSLNPIYRQVPRVVDLCCQHLERHALQTVGIFRIGSSKKRVRQLREEFDQGWEVNMDEENGVHDVAALLKEFFRDLPDPLLTRDLYTAFLNTTLLDHSEQEQALQLLIFLLPACNSDTLHRLLCLLSTVAAHAEDSLDSAGQEIPGNKMTSWNLATIFGPNLLHKTKTSDKEFAVESLARAEESVAVIGVLQRLIESHDALFTVSADLQNEVLVSLLDTDPDVVDHLLRRKASQHSEPDLLKAGDTFPLTGRCSSSDSVKASSGEVSPYDNNSPLLYEYPADGDVLADAAPVFSPTRQHGERSCGTSPSLSTDKGSLGDTSECESHGSSEGLSSRQGNSVLLVRAAQTSLGALEVRPHPPVSRSSSGPHDQRGQRRAQSPLHQPLRGQSGALSSDDLAATTRTRTTGSPACPLLKVRTHSLSGLNFPGQLRETRISHSTPSLQTLRCPAHQTGGRGKGSRAAGWHADKWQIWRILSKESPDALPETLV